MRWFLATVITALAAASSASPQEAAEPGLFERDLLKYRSFFDYGGFEPDLATVFPEGYVSKWGPSLSLEGNYTNNIDKETQGRAGFWASGILGLGWLRRSPELQGSLEYRYTRPVYQTEEVQDRNPANQILAGAMKWQPARRFAVTAGGHLAQNVEKGLGPVLPGVRSTFQNRTDEYVANMGYDWRPSKGVSNTGSYDVSSLNFISDSAEGDDTRRHHASEALGLDVSAWDRLDVDYAYASEEDLTVSSRRQNHGANVAWSHRFIAFPDQGSSVLQISNSLEREMINDGTSFSNEAARAGYALKLSSQTEGGVKGGYKWVFPNEGAIQSGWIGEANLTHRFSPNTDGEVLVARALEFVAQEGEARRSWNWDAKLDHRFSPYTKGHVGASDSWRYEPATTRTDATVLTRTRGAIGSLESRLSRYVDGSLAVTYLNGDPGDSAGGPYWQAGGTTSVTGTIGPTVFWGAQYEAIRRQSRDSEDDFFFQDIRFFGQIKSLPWLSNSLSVSYQRKNYEPGGLGEDYYEVRISIGATVSW